jgi:hypothetical protein
LFVLVAKNTGPKDIQIDWPIYTLTKAGREIADVLEVPHHKEYSLAVMSDIRKRNNAKAEIQIAIYNFSRRLSDSIEFSLEPIAFDE